MNNNVIFVPACLDKPSFQAGKKPSNYDWQDKVLGFLEEKNVTLIPMPCPEYSFFQRMGVTDRPPHGIDYYENLSGFHHYCKECAKITLKKIQKVIDEGDCVVAIVGVEHSPTCAVSYMYTHSGMKKRKGMFFLELEHELVSTHIPMIGINRKFPDKFIRCFDSICTVR